MVTWLMVWMVAVQAIEFNYRLRPLGVQCFTELIGTVGFYAREERKISGYGQGQSQRLQPKPVHSGEEPH